MSQWMLSSHVLGERVSLQRTPHLLTLLLHLSLALLRLSLMHPPLRLQRPWLLCQILLQQSIGMEIRQLTGTFDAQLVLSRV